MVDHITVLKIEGIKMCQGRSVSSPGIQGHSTVVFLASFLGKANSTWTDLACGGVVQYPVITETV